MKKKFTFILIALFCISRLCAVNSSSPQNERVMQEMPGAEAKDSVLNNALDSLASHYDRIIGELSQRLEIADRRVASLENAVRHINDTVLAISENSMKLAEIVDDNSTDLRSLSDTVKTGFNTASQNMDSQKKVMDQRSYIVAAVVFIVLLLAILLPIILHRKGSVKIEDLKKRANDLNEKIVAVLSSEMQELQKISSSLTSLNQTGASDDSRSLILALADRITFMEMTLYRMDTSVRGYKHLSKTLSQMKTNLKAYDYEIVEMLGKSYHDGMKVTASFVEDESLEKGKQIITGIIKPQVNYNGKMIQQAQVTVSQNL